MYNSYYLSVMHVYRTAINPNEVRWATHLSHFAQTKDAFDLKRTKTIIDRKMPHLQRDRAIFDFSCLMNNIHTFAVLDKQWNNGDRLLADRTHRETDVPVVVVEPVLIAHTEAQVVRDVGPRRVERR